MKFEGGSKRIVFAYANITDFSPTQARNLDQGIEEWARSRNLNLRVTFQEQEKESQLAFNEMIRALIAARAQRARVYGVVIPDIEHLSARASVQREMWERLEFETDVIVHLMSGNYPTGPGPRRRTG